MSTQVTPMPNYPVKFLPQQPTWLLQSATKRRDWPRRIVIGGKVQLGNASGRKGPGGIPRRLQTD
jgi:hypothetical protein